MPRKSENLLSDQKLKNLAAKEKSYKLADGSGLYLEVLTTGTKSWRYYYRFGDAKPDKQGREAKPQKTFTIGNYPEVGLADARRRRNEVRELVRKGIDPMQALRYQAEQVQEDTFQAVALAWFDECIKPQSESHASRIMGYLKRDIIPDAGMLAKMKTADITAQHIIPIIKAVRDRGAIDAAKRVKGFIQQIFDYAVVYRYCDRNPVRDIDTKLILPKRIKGHYAAITDPIKVGELLRNIDGYRGGASVRAILKLSPLVFLRPSELKDAEWSEFDLQAATWTLPAKRRKLPTHIKQANRPDDALLVPLSTQVLEILEELHQYTGRGTYLFPSTRGNSRPLSNNAVRVALRAMGYENGEMDAHGFRALASTLLNELGHTEKLIELQLGHAWGNEVKRAYDRSEGIHGRTSMMQQWADYLDGLRSGADVVPFKRKSA